MIAAATFVEDSQGTAFARQYVYGAWWFRGLWLALALAGMVTMWRQRLWHRFSVCLLHVSFLVILAGALTTALTSRQGMIHLRQHTPVNVYMSDDMAVETLPFVIELDTFYIDCYTGTDVPSDYVSRVCVDGGSAAVISMNHILKTAGWRLYQTSFDGDLQGSWLTATYDPYGIAVTYAGYLLLALSALLLLVSRRETFMRLLHHPALKRGLLCAAVLLGWGEVSAFPGLQQEAVAPSWQEQLYHAVPFTPILFIVNLSLGCLLFFYLLYRLLSRSPQPRIKVTAIGRILLLLSLLFHALGYGLRWYISDTIPLTNGYETMQFVALVTLFIAFVLSISHSSFLILHLTAGFLISGFTLLVSHLSQMDAGITHTVPVLRSPWLCSHVSLIMISYSFFAFITLNALLALLLTARKRPGAEVLTLLSRIMLYPAVFMLAVGIFLGAVWANVSWGTYWSWDPKEVWALVTLIVYGITFHRQSLPWLRRPLWFHLYLLLAFFTVLMTYFGVNYLLGGMHSYAG